MTNSIIKLAISEIQIGDKLFDKQNGAIVTVKAITDKSIIIDPNKIIAKNSYLASNFIKYKKVQLPQQIHQKPTKDNLKPGLILEPIIKKIANRFPIKITYVGTDFFLFENSLNQEKSASFRDLQDYKIVDTSQSSQKDNILSKEIHKYNEKVNQISNEISAFIKQYKELESLQNDKIQNLLIKTLDESESLFKELEVFCLLQGIPVKLTEEKVKHLEYSGLRLTNIQGKEILSPMYLSEDDDSSPRYEELIKVFKFSDKDLKMALETILSDQISEYAKQHKEE